VFCTTIGQGENKPEIEKLIICIQLRSVYLRQQCWHYWIGEAMIDYCSGQRFKQTSTQCRWDWMSSWCEQHMAWWNWNLGHAGDGKFSSKFCLVEIPDLRCMCSQLVNISNQYFLGLWNTWIKNSNQHSVFGILVTDLEVTRGEYGYGVWLTVFHVRLWSNENQKYRLPQLIFC
jgi:hypothetical protein